MASESTHHRGSLGAMLGDFETHLRQNSVKTTADRYMAMVRRFVDFVGCGEPLTKLNDDLVREFFNTMEVSKTTKRDAAMIISHFMRFALVRLPVRPGQLGPKTPAPDPVRDAREIALRERWTFDRVLREKEQADDLIAALGRQLVNHYLFFRSRLAGERENLDELLRLSDECRELIDRNLGLFLKLSALNKNLGPIIGERVIR